ncbi:MAG: 3'-5' exonuclease [Helicobacter sp.]|nr:3'-5' exonuclease [Helicobacter sp.]
MGICIFDIETIPDIGLLRSFLGDQFDSSLSPIELCRLAFSVQTQRTNQGFLPMRLHQIICISAVICDDLLNVRKIGSFGRTLEMYDSNAIEKDVLEHFTGYLNAKTPKLVTFNGRNFDIPALLLRSMIYNIQNPWYFDAQSKGKSKWDNYRTRYSSSFSLDLLDELGNFGAAKFFKLNDICNMLDLPGKYDLSGDLVHEIYFKPGDLRANLDEINTYCQSDVLNTYLVLLRYEVLRGGLDIARYGELLDSFLEKIPRDKSYSKYFLDAVKGLRSKI